MICINSIKESTKVINSRAKRKAPVVWRRRQGLSSGITFTTYERASLADSKTLITESGKTAEFNLGKLLISIASALRHNPKSASYDSLWLAQTVEEKLLMAPEPQLTLDQITQATYDMLKRFDELAAIQYGASHGIIVNVRRRRRGRPSIAP